MCPFVSLGLAIFGHGSNDASSSTSRPAAATHSMLSRFKVKVKAMHVGKMTTSYEYHQRDLGWLKDY